MAPKHLTVQAGKQISLLPNPQVWKKAIAFQVWQFWFLMLNFGVIDRIKTASVAKTLQISPTTCAPAGFLGLDSSILGSFGSSSSATQKATSAVQRRSPMGRSAWWVQKAGVQWLPMIIHKEQRYNYDYDISACIYYDYI